MRLEMLKLHLESVFVQCCLINPLTIHQMIAMFGKNSHVTWRKRLSNALKMLRKMIFLYVPNFGFICILQPKISRINNSFLITPLTQALNYLSLCHLRKIPGWVFHVGYQNLVTCTYLCTSSHLLDSCRSNVGMTLCGTKTTALVWQ